MARITVNKTDLFQVPKGKFCIGFSSSGYTLNYSADGVNWTAWEDSTDANTNQMVVNAPLNVYYKLAGNTQDNVIVTY